MKNQQDYQKIAKKILQKQISNALQSDKGNAMLTSLIQQVCGLHIQQKVKKYCQKYVRQEIQRFIEEIEPIKSSHSLSPTVNSQETRDLYGLLTVNKDKIMHIKEKAACRHCGSHIEEKKGEENVQKMETKKSIKEKPKLLEETKLKNKESKSKKTPFLKKVKSEEKVHLVKGQPFQYDHNRKDRNAVTDKGGRIQKSKSQNSESNIFGTEYSWKDKIVMPTRTQDLAKDKIRKVQKHLSKISDNSSGYQLQEQHKLKQIIEDNSHLGSKEIAHLIKGMQQLSDISKVAKVESNQIDLHHSQQFKNKTPFHKPDGISLKHKIKNEDYDFSSVTQRYWERDRGESEYIARACQQYSPELNKGKSFENRKNGKSNKEKGKIFMKMMEIYGQQNRTQMFYFIEKNEHLNEGEIISKWKSEIIE